MHQIYSSSHSKSLLAYPDQVLNQTKYLKKVGSNPDPLLLVSAGILKTACVPRSRPVAITCPVASIHGSNPHHGSYLSSGSLTTISGSSLTSSSSRKAMRIPNPEKTWSIRPNAARSSSTSSI